MMSLHQSLIAGTFVFLRLGKNIFKPSFWVCSQSDVVTQWKLFDLISDQMQIYRQEVNSHYDLVNELTTLSYLIDKWEQFKCLLLGNGPSDLWYSQTHSRIQQQGIVLQICIHLKQKYIQERKQVLKQHVYFLKNTINIISISIEILCIYIYLYLI